MNGPNRHSYTEGEAANIALGLSGTPDRIDDLTTHDAKTETPHGFWMHVKALTDVTFDAGTEVNGATGVIASGDQLLQGDTMTIPFTAIQLSAGTLVAIPG